MKLSLAALGLCLAAVVTASAPAAASCGKPAAITQAQRALPPVTLGVGQDLRLHVSNRHAASATVAVAFRVAGTEHVMGRRELTLGAGESVDVSLAEACLFKICVLTPEDVEAGAEPVRYEPVVSLKFDAPVRVAVAPSAFEDPLVGFEDPLLGFEDPIFGFEDPLLGFEDPLLGFSFEVFDSATGLTSIWGNGGTFIWGNGGTF